MLFYPQIFFLCIIIIKKKMNDGYDYSVDFTEIVKRALKYLIEGFAVALAAYFIPNGKLRLRGEEVLMISMTAAATFAVLDMYSPSIALAARSGSGFGVGANLVGFPKGPGSRQFASRA